MLECDTAIKEALSSRTIKVEETDIDKVISYVSSWKPDLLILGKMFLSYNSLVPRLKELNIPVLKQNEAAPKMYTHSVLITSAVAGIFSTSVEPFVTKKIILVDSKPIAI